MAHVEPSAHAEEDKEARAEARVRSDRIIPTGRHTPLIDRVQAKRKDTEHCPKGLLGIFLCVCVEWTAGCGKSQEELF